MVKCKKKFSCAPKYLVKFSNICQVYQYHTLERFGCTTWITFAALRGAALLENTYPKKNNLKNGTYKKSSFLSLFTL